MGAGHEAVFALPEGLAAKAAPSLVEQDERHLALVAATLAVQVASISEQLDVLRKAPGGKGRGAMDRDLEIHRLSSRLRLLRRFGLDACLGRVVRAGDPTPTYIGRLALADANGDPLLVDWRAPAAEPFFAATLANPLGLSSRRRYRWSGGRIVDYWDEVLTLEARDDDVALDEDSALIASLRTSRTPQMQDVLATIQADQDAIIRAASRGALVVDGGPGTGKTVVALHRAAYLLYADPRLGEGRGGVLFVGPHQPYLAYVADVLPSLGEYGVQTCTIRDLVAEGADAQQERDPAVARLKSSALMVTAVEPAVGLYEEPPASPAAVETAWSDIRLTAEDWAEAFDAVDSGTPHNEAQTQVWEALLEILLDNSPDTDVPQEALRRSLESNQDLRTTFRRAWPVLEPTDLVADLWAVPAYLRRCAPWLSPDDVRALARPEGAPWTVSDLPLLDAMRQRLGDPEAAVRQRRREALLAADREYMDRVVDYLLETDDDPESSLSLLRRESLRDDLVDEGGLPSVDPDRLAGPFAHVIVDEAQELTDAEWQMLLRRCPSRSVTVVGDRAQARHGFTESWEERLARVGFDTIAQASLSINYRTPEEVMAVAEPVIREALPDANVPTSIRSSGIPVRYGRVADLTALLGDWLATHHEGTACVLGARDLPDADRVRSLTPETAKGLEFDLVVVVDPDDFGSGIEGAVDRYVAMTRTTRELVILTSDGRSGRGRHR